MRAGVRAAALAAGQVAGLFAFSRWLHRGGFVALTYHGVVDVDHVVLESAPYVYRNCVTVQQFKEHVQFLSRWYRLLDGDGLTRVLRGGSIPPYAATLTFDDGLRCHASVVAPVLRELGAPGFFFLPTALVDGASAGQQVAQWTERLAALLVTASERGRLPAEWRGPVADIAERMEGEMMRLSPEVRRSRMEEMTSRLGVSVEPTRFPADRRGNSILDAMSWDDVRALAQAGMEIGSHTVTHANLAALDEFTVEAELRESSARIAAETGRRCRFFAYPYGRHSHMRSSHGAALPAAGYVGAFTQLPGINRPQTFPFALNRIDIAGDCRLPRLAYYASGARSLLRACVVS